MTSTDQQACRTWPPLALEVTASSAGRGRSQGRDGGSLPDMTPPGRHGCPGARNADTGACERRGRGPDSCGGTADQDCFRKHAPKLPGRKLARVPYLWTQAKPLQEQHKRNATKLKKRARGLRQNMRESRQKARDFTPKTPRKEGPQKFCEHPVLRDRGKMATVEAENRPRKN